MKLILKNIGMLKEAEVSLDPLCVIAGVNDNGKSTIGKVVFCIIKAINRYKEDLKVSKDHEIKKLIADAYFELRPLTEDRDTSFSWFDFRIILMNDNELKDSVPIFRQFLLKLKEIPALDKSVLNIIQDIESRLKLLLEQPEDTKRFIENAFTRVFAAEFDSQVLLSGAQGGFIQVWENDLQLINLNIDRNNKVTVNGEIEPIVIRDATFIETPLILNFHDLLISSQTQLELHNVRALGIPYTTLHTKDLFDKLRVPVLPSESRSAVLLSQIRTIVDGDLQYDKSQSNFVFKRASENISIKNTASGIKVFGLLQILLANEFITKNTLVVFDEPENHLHPKWQLKLAEVLVELVSQGVYIIVSSHSPYMIEALERYSALKGLEGSCSFYLAENNKVENKSQLPEIFALLSEPFDEFRQLDAKVLHDE